MNKYVFVSAILTLFLLVLGSACKKEASADKKAPVITITIPETDYIYDKSNDMTFTGVISDNKELKEITFSLSNNLKGASGLDETWNPDSDTREIEGELINYSDEPLFSENIPFDCKGGQYTLTIKVLDASDNETINIVDVYIQ